MFPNTAPDIQFADFPLPPGPFPCPLRRFGHDIRYATPQQGPGAFFKTQAASLGYPRVWKALTKRKTPIVILSGASTVKSILRQEFEALLSNAVAPFSSRVVGQHSLRSAHERQRHSFLRRLVGEGFSGEAVADAIPILQQTAQEEIKQLLGNYNGKSVRMEDVCQHYTLNIAWRQILGLNLGESEVLVFVQNVQDWMSGLYDPAAMETSMKAREYLVSKIEQRMAELEREGPDGSTLGRMVFAVDDVEAYDSDAAQRRLTHDQVVDNSLLLIFAGSDTSAGTLTAALFSMGIHPTVWNKLVDEQQRVIEQHGTELTKDILDNECPYLDAVVKETMRLFPIVGGSARATKQTILVDGKYQVPKGWAVLYDRWLTHRQDPITFRDDGLHMDPVHGFEPERWLDDKTRPTSEYIPFGAGPRYCLGAELALVEMKTFLAVMARQMDYELVVSRDAIEWKMESMFQIPADGVEAIPRERVLAA